MLYRYIQPYYTTNSAYIQNYNYLIFSSFEFTLKNSTAICNFLASRIVVASIPTSFSLSQNQALLQHTSPSVFLALSARRHARHSTRHTHTKKHTPSFWQCYFNFLTRYQNPGQIPDSLANTAVTFGSRVLPWRCWFSQTAFIISLAYRWTNTPTRCSTSRANIYFIFLGCGANRKGKNYLQKYEGNVNLAQSTCNHVCR